MKITGISAVVVGPDAQLGPRQVETDEGSTGWGRGLGGRPAASLAASRIWRRWRSVSTRVASSTSTRS